MYRQSDKITVLYCRVDTGGSEETARSAILNQQNLLLQYAVENSLPNPCVFIDLGFSGNTADRPEFQCMCRKIEFGHVAHLVVKDLSRLFRDTVKGNQFVGEFLPKHSVALHCLNGSIPQPFRGET